MSKAMKIWFIVAASLVLGGCMIFAGAIAVLNWDLQNLSTDQYENNSHEITEDFSAIAIYTDTADVEFLPCEDSICRVECYEKTNMTHTVSVKDGTLTVELVDTRKWYEHIGINFGAPKITVYMPRGEYGAFSVSSDTSDVKIPKDFKFESIDVSLSTGDVLCCASAADTVKIATTTGDISIENISAALLDLSVSTGTVTASDVVCEGDVKVGVSTGKTYLTDIACQSVISSGSTGDMFLKNVIAAERFSIDRSTGDVNFDGCDAAEIYVNTDTGDVEGSLLSEKVFIANTDTGKKKVPNTVSGGRCEIRTDTGDIEITIK